MKLKMNLQPGDDDYDERYGLYGFRKPPVRTQAEIDMIELEVIARAARRQRDMYNRKWGLKKPRN
jgi:hypothetical protein